MITVRVDNAAQAVEVEASALTVPVLVSLEHGAPATFTYLHIRYANTLPTSDADVQIGPGAYIGTAVTRDGTAPTDYAAYNWFRWKGDRGEQGIQGDQGIPGYTPIKGVDYFDGKDGYTPIKGVDYFDGYTPVKGIDYFDGESAYAIAVKGGYLGTEQEFADDLANFEERAAVAVDGAQRAETAAGSAASAAGVATGAASEANTSADRAEAAKQGIVTAEANAAASANAAKASENAAKAAQKAAEDARDAAGEIVGGDFATKTEAKGYAAEAEQNAKDYTDEQIGKIPTPDVSGQIGTHNADETAHPAVLLAAKNYTDQKISDIPTPDVSGQIQTHNTSPDAHDDIRREVSDKANIDSPSFTGTPTAPTAADGNSSKQIANTEFVMLAKAAAAKAAVVNANLVAGAWVNGVQTVAVRGVTADSNVTVGLAATATPEQFDAAAKGKLFATSLGAGVVTVTAYGEVPAINVPITVIIWGVDVGTVGAATLADLGVSATATELNYSQGLTGNIQAQLAALAANAGGAKIETGSYTGTGKNSKTLILSFEPKLVLVYRAEYGIFPTGDSARWDSDVIFWTYNQTAGIKNGNSGNKTDITFALSATSLTWSASDSSGYGATNVSGKTYHYIAIG